MDLRNNKSLATRFILASGWILGEHGLGQFLRFIGNLILTRLLAPEMFGVMAIAHVVISGIAMFSDVGLDLNIIRSKRGMDVRFLNTVWTMQIIRGLVLCLSIIGLSFLIHTLALGDVWRSESVYRNAHLPSVICLLAVSPLIDGFKSTKMAVANRKLDMRKLAFIQFGSQVVGVASMVILALINPNIYALVFGGILGRFVLVLSSHYFLPGENNYLDWDKEAFKEIIGFGKWIFFTSILGFLLVSGDKIILGALIDPENMGLYSLAMALVLILVGISNKIVGKIGYAAISEVNRHNAARVKEIYYRIRYPLDGGILFITGIIFMTGNEIIKLLYDDRYQYAGHIIEILVISLIFNRYAFFSRVLSALGRPDLNVWINIIGLVSLYVGLPTCFAMYGFNGALWFIALHKLPTLPFIFYLKIKFGLNDTQKELAWLIFLGFGLWIGYLITIATG